MNEEARNRLKEMALGFMTRRGMIHKQDRLDLYMAGAKAAWELREEEVETAKEINRLLANRNADVERLIAEAVKAERERCAELVSSAFSASLVEPLASIVKNKILNPKADG